VHVPADGSKDDSAFDDRLAALKAAKKQAAYGSSRKDNKDKEAGPKQGMIGPVEYHSLLSLDLDLTLLQY